MEKLIEQRREFNRVMDLPIGEKPSLIEVNRWMLHRNMLIEEVEEYDEACRKRDLVGIADSLGDILYVLVGAVAEHGMINCIEEILDEIQRSNMSKVGPDGTVIKDENGKVRKPENYFKPNLKRIIENHLAKFNNQTKLDL